MVSATIRTIFAKPDATAARAHLRQVADTLAGRFPAAADALLDAENELLAYADFPRAHWRRIWSTNPLERVNKKIKRRTDVVGVSPPPPPLPRRAGPVLAEQHDEWAVPDRRYLSEGSMTALTNTPPEVVTGELLTAS